MTPVYDDEWVGALAGKNLLVILDNCEHVLAAAAAVAKSLLERCPNVRILATSREPLRIAGEVVVRLRTLAQPHADAAPAIRLFLDRASDVAPDFAQIDQDDPRMIAIERLCRRLDGLPLAIELAAAHAGAVSPEMLVRALEQHNGCRASAFPPRRPATKRCAVCSTGAMDYSTRRNNACCVSFRSSPAEARSTLLKRCATVSSTASRCCRRCSLWSRSRSWSRTRASKTRATISWRQRVPTFASNSSRSASTREPRVHTPSIIVRWQERPMRRTADPPRRRGWLQPSRN